MKKILLLLIIVCAACSNQNKNNISYTVSPTQKNGKPALNVFMEFKANPSGETVVLIQDNAWGQENLHNTLSDLQSDLANEIIQEKDSSRFIIKHDPNVENIDLSYTVHQDTEGELTTRGTYRPVIQEDYFHVFSHNFFMLPKDYVPDSNAHFDVNIKWQGFDKDYNLVNSFDTNEREQIIKNTTERYFHSAVFTGGDYRPYDIDVKGNKAVLGIRGNWEAFQDSTLVNTLKHTLEVQRDFWQDHSQEYFAVTMTPTYGERGYSYQGSGLTNSFATSATNNKYLEYAGLVYLFNHELQHNWIGHLIKNENEEEQYWFSEGFTEYYTIKNIAKNKIGGLDEAFYIDKFNEFIMNLSQSSAKEAPNSEMTYENFWKSFDYSKLPYRRGAIFAFYLDHKIQQDSDGILSLDDLMLEIKKDAQEKGQLLSHDYFLSKANEFLIEELNPFFDKHIIKGEFFDLAAIFTEFGYEYNKTATVFNLGLTFTENNAYIAEIDETSNAYKAGLRKGDRITKRSYSYEPTSEAELTVKKNGKEKIIKFYPAKEDDIPTLSQSDSNKKALSFGSN